MKKLAFKPAALPVYFVKIFLASYSFNWPKTLIHQADSLFLPLVRLFLITFWPPRLLILTRKPWVFFSGGY